MKGMKFRIQASDVKSKPPQPRQAAFAGVGRLRKVACLGGAHTLKYTPWFDPTWELWAHASCRHLCKRDPDLLWDLHPSELWRDPKKKTWDPKYTKWIATNRVPIMMQDVYPDAPASMRYPIEQVQTEFQLGYMANHLAYMVALALIQGVTHLGIFGCEYDTNSEYGPQRGSAEFWLGIAWGRGVHICLPPTSSLLNRPHLEYGYESHPNGKRDPSYSFSIGPLTASGSAKNGGPLIAASAPDAPPLRDIGVPPALDRRDKPVSEWFKGADTWQPDSGAGARPTTTSPVAQPPAENAPSRTPASAKSKCTAAASAPARRRATNGTRMSRSGRR